MAHFWGFELVLHGQIPFLCRGIIACAPCEKASILQAITPLCKNRVWPHETRFGLAWIYKWWEGWGCVGGRNNYRKKPNNTNDWVLSMTPNSNSPHWASNPLYGQNRHKLYSYLVTDSGRKIRWNPTANLEPSTGNISPGVNLHVW